MIKKLSALTLPAAVYLSLAIPAFAASVNPCPAARTGGFTALCGYGLGKVGEIVRDSITILFIIATIVALFFLIFGGIRWITSGGDKTQLETARNTILAAAIGLVLVFLSYFILNVVLQLFGMPTVQDYTIPTL